MSVRIRLADPERDAARILAVYAPYVRETAVSFETETPTLEAFARRVAGIAAEFPYLLLEIDGELVGYAYAHRQAERAAFGWNAELSIYMDRAYCGGGLGAPLYALLERLLAMQGYVNLYAVITEDNRGSLAFHERMGYRQVGLHQRTGWKLGAWHGVVHMHKRLTEGEPGQVVPVGALDGAAVARLAAQTAEEIAAICRKNGKLSSKKT